MTEAGLSETHFTHFATIYNGDVGVNRCFGGFGDSWPWEPILHEREIRSELTLLLDPYKNLEYLGWNALQSYQNKQGLCYPDRHSEYYFFRDIKVYSDLYNFRFPNNHLTVTAENGSILPAVTVYGEYLRYIRRKCWEEMEKMVEAVALSEKVFLWVLLVPAGWSDAARQMMSEAAVVAGLNSAGSEFELVSEPVAAILFEQQEELFYSANPPTFEHCELVVICENTRIDVTVQRITKKSDGTIVIEEIHNSRLPYGFHKVNKEFEKLLQKTFYLSDKELETIKYRYARIWAKLVYETFSHIVQRVVEDSPRNSEVEIQVPNVIRNEMRPAESSGMHNDSDSYVFQYSTIVSLCNPLIANLTRDVEKILSLPECNSVTHVLIIARKFGNRILADLKAKIEALHFKVTYGSSPCNIDVTKGAAVYSIMHGKIEIRPKKLLQGDKELLMQQIQKNQGLDQNLTQLNQEHQKLHHHALQLRQENQKLEQQSKYLIQTNQELNQQLAELNQLRHGNQQLNQHVLQLRQENQQLGEQSRELLQENQQLKQVNQELDQQSRELLQENQQLRQANQELDQQSRQLLQENQQLGQQSTQLRQACQELDQQSRQLVEENQRLKQQGNQLSWIVQQNDLVLSTKELGEGAYGSVREATFHGCKVAVKCIHKLVVSDYNLHIFNREMTMAARCHHPNLVQFIGATREGDYPMLVTELMHTSLHKLLQNEQLRSDQIIPIVFGVACGLNYLHQSTPSIIHRDISSPNVLLNPLPSGQWLAKVSDLGSSNFVHASHTKQPGNPCYAAPEALDPNKGPHTAAMDVFSFGVLTHELCTRIQPDGHLIIPKVTKSSSNWRAPERHLAPLIICCIAPDIAQRCDMGSVVTELNNLLL